MLQPVQFQSLTNPAIPADTRTLLSPLLQQTARHLRLIIFQLLPAPHLPLLPVGHMWHRRRACPLTFQNHVLYLQETIITTSGTRMFWGTFLRDILTQCIALHRPVIDESLDLIYLTVIIFVRWKNKKNWTSNKYAIKISPNENIKSQMKYILY